VEEAEALIVSSGHSRLLVVGQDLDDVVGFVHAKDLLTVPADARRRALPLARIRRVLVLPDGRPLDDVLVAMRRSRTHVAVVVGDDRRVSGLATLEDVLEHLVGDIRDESDRTLPRRRTAR
jgi:CBS domain containing-hemolysin-like protein